eukprot:23134-Prymnesium_polylepis.1
MVSLKCNRIAARRPPFRRSFLLNDLSTDRCPPTPLIDCRSLRYLADRSRPEQQALRHLPWASRLVIFFCRCARSAR